MLFVRVASHINLRGEMTRPLITDPQRMGDRGLAQKYRMTEETNSAVNMSQVYQIQHPFLHSYHRLKIMVILPSRSTEIIDQGRNFD